MHSTKLTHEHLGELGRQRFNEVPGTRTCQLDDSLSGGLIVDRAMYVVRQDRKSLQWSDDSIDFEALRLVALGIGHPHRRVDLESFDNDHVHIGEQLVQDLS